MARDESPHENVPDRPRYRQPPFAPRDVATGDARTPTRHDWERLPADPDLHHDLGYRLADWEVFQANDQGENVMFLPSDEQLLKTDAFIVADASSICNVSDRT